MKSNDLKKSNQGIIVPVITFGIVGLFCILLFTIVHKLFKDIYQPRRILNRGRPPSISQGILSWFWVTYKTREEFLVNTVGVDGVMLLRFFKLGYRLFFALSILGLGILAPTNYYSNIPRLGNATGYDLESILIPALSIDNIPKRSPYLKIVLGCTYIFSFLTYGFLIVYYRRFITLKLQHDEFVLRRTRLSKTEMRTVMVFGIPRELRNEVDLAVYFDHLCIGRVETVVLCRNWSLLQKAVQNRSFYLEKLEELCTKYGSGNWMDHTPFAHQEDLVESMITDIKRRFLHVEKRPKHRTGFLGIFGRLEDSVEYYCNEFTRWNKTVKSLRKTPEKSSPTGVAFVTFESPMSAILASQTVVHTDPFSCMIRMAPEPRDIYWPNLSARTAHSYSKVFRSIVAIGSMFLLVTSSTFVVYSIAGLIDLEQLGAYFPFLGRLIKDLPQTFVQFIQGVIPTMLLAGWNSCLPTVLLVLCHVQGLEAVSWIQLSLLSKYFFYLIWNTVFVIPFASTVLYKILLNPQKVIEKLGEMLPKSSTTMINYTILQAFGVFPAQLLLAAPLVLTWGARFFSKSTPRQTSNAYYPSILTYINYGVIYPVPILIFIIGLMYAPISPLILPFCTIFFAIGYIVYKYILMYVHIPSYESKGTATPYVINRCLFGLVVMQLTMMGVLALKSAEPDQTVMAPEQWSEYAKMVIGVAPLLFMTYFVYNLLKQAYEKQIRNVPLEVVGNAQRSFMSENDSAGPLHEAQELTELDSDNRLRNRLSLFSNHSVPQASETGTDETDVNTKTRLTNRYSVISLLDPTIEEDSPFHDPDEEDPELEVSFQHTSYESIENPNDMLRHVEPPMTRVPGILDIPIGSAMLKYGEQEYETEEDEDRLLYSYLHPSLIGRLSVAWLPEQQFDTLRREQVEEQKKLLKRFTYRQRLGLENSVEGNDEGNERGNALRGFIDGFTSWIHLALS